MPLYDRCLEPAQRAWRDNMWATRAGPVAHAVVLLEVVDGAETVDWEQPTMAAIFLLWALFRAI